MKKISIFSIGLLTGIIITVSGVAGAATYLKAIPKSVKIVVGSSQKSVEAMNVNNKLYVPVRDAGASFGYSVSGVTSTTVTFAEEVSASASTTTSTSTTTSSTGGYVVGMHDKYGTDGKLDAAKVKAGIEAGEITINSQDENGDSLLHWVIREDNFSVYTVIKLNALNVNLQNDEGVTPLMLAVKNKNNFYFGELTNTFKADAKLKDDSGKQAIDYAEKGSSEYVKLQGYMM